MKFEQTRCVVLRMQNLVISAWVYITTIPWELLVQGSDGFLNFTIGIRFFLLIKHVKTLWLPRLKCLLTHSLSVLHLTIIYTSDLVLCSQFFFYIGAGKIDLTVLFAKLCRPFVIPQSRTIHKRVVAKFLNQWWRTSCEHVGIQFQCLHVDW